MPKILPNLRLVCPLSFTLTKPVSIVFKIKFISHYLVITGKFSRNYEKGPRNYEKRPRIYEIVYLVITWKLIVSRYYKKDLVISRKLSRNYTRKDLVMTRKLCRNDEKNMSQRELSDLKLHACTLLYFSGEMAHV